MVARGMVIALSVCAVCAASAPAATTLGRVAEEVGAGCAAGTSHLQASSAADRPSYLAPHDGVVTSWTTRAGPAAGDARLQVWRHVDGARYGLVAMTPAQRVPAGQPVTFPTRVPVDEDDRLGLHVPTSGFPCMFATSDPSDSVASVTFADPPSGRILTFGAPETSRALNVSAVLEPDADGDAFGDQTQDRCVGVASQSDIDGDGAGDTCDPDLDGDGRPNEADNCTAQHNDQADADGDGVGDVCDQAHNPLVIQTTAVRGPAGPERLRAWFGTSAVRARPGKRVKVAFVSSGAAPARIDIRRGKTLIRRIRRQARAGRTTVTVQVPRRPGRYVLTLLVRTGPDRKATDRVPLRVSWSR